ncbi:MAG: NAD-dependent epimerase/dehydratase family protein [Ginsengibacter sp.]
MKEEFDVNNKSNEKKILVTGGAGIVGGELINQLLNKGENVLAIYHSTQIPISHPSLQIEQCDILDVDGLQEIMQPITHVYHAAALVSYDPKDKQQLLKVNVEGTANIVNSSINAGVEKLIHVSSVAALGRNRDGQMVNEKMNWTQETSNSIYGKSKYYAEMEVWRGIGEGLKAVIVNPSLILGGNSWETSSASIFKNVYNEFPWYTEGVSGFVDVRDVARAMILLMNSDITSERFILNGENVSFKEVFSMIAKCFGKNPPHKKVTRFLAEVVWRIEAVKGALTGKRHLLTKETARTALKKVYFDNSKILQSLAEFHFTGLKDTIEFTCEKMKEKYKL